MWHFYRVTQKNKTPKICGTLFFEPTLIQGPAETVEHPLHTFFVQPTLEVLLTCVETRTLASSTVTRSGIGWAFFLLTYPFEWKNSCGTN